MACSTSLLLALGLLCLLSELHVTSAVHHEVGDLNGKWGVESYFQAGDSLSFSHHAHSAEVHRVTRDDYKACKAAKPIETYRGSRNNVATLGEATTYYFISGDSKLCMKGRKLMVVAQQATGAGAPATAPATAPTSPKAASPTPTSVASPPAAAPAPTTNTEAPAPVAVTAPPPAAAPPTAATPPAATVPAPSAGEPTAEVPPIASSPAGSPEGAPGSPMSSPPSPPSPSSSPGLPPAGSSAAALIISSSYALALMICTSLLFLLA